MFKRFVLSASKTLPCVNMAVSGGLYVKQSHKILLKSYFVFITENNTIFIFVLTL